jgi:hypothetical protein
MITLVSLYAAVSMAALVALGMLLLLSSRRTLVTTPPVRAMAPDLVPEGSGLSAEGIALALRECGFVIEVMTGERIVGRGAGVRMEGRIDVWDGWVLTAQPTADRAGVHYHPQSVGETIAFLTSVYAGTERAGRGA